MSNGLRNAAAIVAEGMHVVGEDQPRISSLELQLHACQRAMAAAGVDRRDVGAVFTGRAPMSFTAMEWNMRIITELKIVPKLSSEITVHGAGCSPPGSMRRWPWRTVLWSTRCAARGAWAAGGSTS